MYKNWGWGKKNLQTSFYKAFQFIDAYVTNLKTNQLIFTIALMALIIVFLTTSSFLAVHVLYKYTYNILDLEMMTKCGFLTTSNRSGLIQNNIWTLLWQLWKKKIVPQDFCFLMHYLINVHFWSPLKQIRNQKIIPS